MITEPSADAGEVRTALVRLRDRLAESSFALDTPGAEPARRAGRAIVQQIDDYVLPRLDRPDAPLLVVVGGPTGAGKSTLVNTLAGRMVTPAGVLRPTTRTPVLICAGRDEQWFVDAHVLPGLGRSTHAVASNDGLLHIARCDTLPPGLAIVDAPDIDSVVRSNRELASRLLAAADLWLFVTTAERYADAAPWDFLRDARSRGAAVAVALDRVPAGSEQEATRHFARLLDANGLGDAPFFVIDETPLQGGLLPGEKAAPLRSWLVQLGSDPDARRRLVEQTLDGTVAGLGARLAPLTREAGRQQKADATLRGGVTRTFAQATEGFDAAVAGGALLTGDVLTRWRDFVGTGDIARALDAGSSDCADALSGALRDAVCQLVLATVDQVRVQIADRWAHHPAGRSLLDRWPYPETPSADLPERAVERLEAWRHEVVQLVDERLKASVLRHGASLPAPEVIGLILMIVAVTPSGDAPAQARGETRAARALLETVLGVDTARQLVAEVRRDLQREVYVLLDAEAERYTGALDEAAVPGDSVDLLREVRFGLDAARS
ncbi:MAG: dynamin family protein [Streptosporangiales bacterium]